MTRALFLLISLAGCASPPSATAPPAPYRITVVDKATGRGVPLIELTTTSSLRFVTDSAGVVAFDEPGLLGQRVWFTVRGHGYACPKDGFGFEGAALDTTPGGSGRIEIDRVNVAERLYRITGEGLYRDTLLTGGAPPIREPVLNGGVTGQDSAVPVVYRGRILWFWGDTNRAAYPLGNFHTSGASSLLPDSGGLDPAVGVDLHYFTGGDGFSRPMIPFDAPGPVWISGLCVVGGRLLCFYARMKSLGEIFETGIALWDDAAELFKKEKELPATEPLHPAAQALPVAIDGVEYLLFPTPYPDLRVRATLEDVLDPARYEGFTCLEPGARLDLKKPAIERDAHGHVVWGWKRNTPPVSEEDQRKLHDAGALRLDEMATSLRDVETGAFVMARPGSVSWNPHRRRWMMIFGEVMGTSVLGETWYSEADTPTGPWGWARKIVTHDDYSFYNVVEHPFFRPDGGRHVFFEGTYTTTFSGAKVPTPLYDYNQVMYRLDVDDPRLHLPAPVYVWKGGWGTREAAADWPRGIESVAFCARPPGRPGEGSIPVYFAPTPAPHLTTESAGATLAFHALPDANDDKSPTKPLWEFVRKESGARTYLVDGDPGAGWTRSARPLCRVWPSSTAVLALDGAAPR